MIQRACFESLGRFDENFRFAHLEDIDLRRRIFQAGVEWRFVEEAVVDHPPRIRGFGWQLAKLRKSDVYLRLKYRERATLQALCREVIRGRVAPIMRHRLSLDTIIAVISTIIEVACVVALHRKWKNQCQETVSLSKSA
jgi:GT2 family glycosyltransferase